VILVDTSVWVDHLRRGNPALAALLTDGEVVTHPFVIGELSLGLSRRIPEVLDLLDELPALAVASHGEVLNMVERRGLAGKGIGWVDAHLVAAASLAHVALWTRDRPLSAVATKLAIAWTPAHTAKPGA